MVFGNLTRDPEMRQLPSGTNVTNLGIATNRYYNNQQGEKVEETEFHNVVLFGRQAEVAHQYLKKGSSVFIEGRLRTSSWEADGVKKYKTEIVAENMQLGPRRAGDASAPAAAPADSTPAAAPQKGGAPEPTINPEDIPF